MKTHNDKEANYLVDIVKGLVNHPEDVIVGKDEDEMGVLLTLYVNPQDLGDVIGRQGQTARSIRTLLRVHGARCCKRINLKIAEPQEEKKCTCVCSCCKC